MQNFPPRPRADVPELPDAAFGVLLAGGPAVPPEVAGLQPVTGLLAALTAAAEPGELTGHDRALAEFRQFAARRAVTATGTRVPAARARHARGRGHGRRPATPLRALPGRLAVTGGAAAVLFGSIATAAYANVLPPPVQRLAHATIGAPSPAPHRPGGQFPAGPGNSGTAGGRSSGPASPSGAATGGGRSSGAPGHASARPGGAPAAPPGHARRHGQGKPTVLPTPTGRGRGTPPAGAGEPGHPAPAAGPTATAG